jgi:hypothetical protein
MTLAREVRVVTSLPLSELWSTRGIVPASRSSSLDPLGVLNELLAGPPSIVVAEIGRILLWVPPAASFEAWTRTFRAHAVDPDAAFDPASLPDGYAYVPSLWLGPGGERFVVLERHP